MNYALRKATENDAAEINLLFIEMMNTIDRTDGSKGYESGYLNRYFTDSDDRIYVAETDSGIVGFLSVEAHRKEGFLYLDDFSVTKKFRGFGIGTSLMKKAEEYAKEIGVLSIALHVEKSNTDACRFYQRFGYTVKKDEGNRLFMKKPSH